MLRACGKVGEQLAKRGLVGGSASIGGAGARMAGGSPAPPQAALWRRAGKGLEFGQIRCLSTASDLSDRGEGGKTAAMLEERSKATAQQIKDLGKKSWFQWTMDHQDELLVLLLSSMFLVTTLRLQRVKGEMLDEQKESTKKIADLEARIERLEAEVRSSVENGAAKAGKELRLWDSQVVKLKATILKAVETGVKAASPQTLEDEAREAEEKRLQLAAEGKGGAEKPRMI